ncbi:MAG TPA: hypothetical protein VGG48_10945 [Rhizomicrobium sp.]|jgi:hypothetical protein
MQIWFGFYSVVAGMAATLMGLLFVSVSINAAAILGDAHENEKRLAEQAFANYLAVLLVSLFAIFPTLTISQLGSSALAVTALGSVWVLVRLYQVVMSPQESGLRLQALRRQFSSLLGYGMLIYAAARMAFGPGDTRNLFGVAVIVLLSSATAVSWGLLLKLAKEKEV